MSKEKKDEWVPQQKEIEALHTMKIEHNYDVNFSVVSDKKDFLDALLEIDSTELGSQIKKLIESQDRQFTVE
jgi:thiamine pyrophosphate-dependent acetolactate synthase large subunit-like protein|tara:strand:- start:2054 stop:2269 length:216 start_codon:yes stop_codon:yes gene_type:complete